TFSFSKTRQTILKGLLDYRKALYEAKIVNGFQWVDGSFMEDVETLENRAPNDLDVVTFFCLPNDESQESLYKQCAYLFDNDAVKDEFCIDGYVFPLGEKMANRHVRQI